MFDLQQLDIGIDTQKRYGLPFPFEIMWEITHQCNLSCKNCYKYSNEKSDHDELNFNEIETIINELDKNELMLIFFDGGEPFIRPDFLTILEKCTTSFSTYILTNGTLVTESIANELSNLKVSAVFVQIESPNRKTHDEMTGVNGSFEATLEGINHLVSAGLRVSIASRLTQNVYSELNSLFSLGERLNVNKINLMQLYPTGRAKHNFDEQYPSLEELHNLSSHIMSMKPNIRISHPFYPDIHNCCNQFCTIDAFGQVFPCSYLRENLVYGNVRKSTLKDIWNEPDYLDFRNIVVHDTCPSCLNYNVCGGGCRSVANRFFGRWDAPDPTCSQYHRLKGRNHVKI